MAIPLYDLTVASYLQTIGAIENVLTKGLAFAQEKGKDPADLVAARLYEDMLPLSFQIASVAHHSLNAINGVKAGLFAPPGKTPPHTYADLQEILATTRKGLEAFTPEEVNALENADVVFEVRDLKLPFTGQGFLLSFSLPNFYFHAATAYDILRANGVPLGKRDFLGQMRMKGM